MEKEAKRKLEMMLQQNSIHQIESIEEQKEDYIDQLIREKIQLEQEINYLNAEVKKLNQDNSVLQQELSNFQKILNQRTIEFQYL